MKISTPRWWYRREGGGVLSGLLRPLSALYADQTARRVAQPAAYDPGVPVISVGNLTVGGSGKTPVTREILHLLARRGVDAHALSRGYGGRLEGPISVDPDGHTAADVGDEPLMLAQHHPIWIARDRAAGARAAVAAGAQAIVLDDGHQNPALKKTLSLVVVDGETRNGEWPFGDGSVFPAGPMREPLKAGLDGVNGRAKEGADVKRRDLRDRRCLSGGRSRRRPRRFPHRDELRIDHVAAPHALIEGFDPAAGTVRRQEVEVRGSGLLLVTESAHACGPFAQPKSDTPKVGG